jgi:ubiquinone biosynthesis accessory factor UbiJ
MRGPAAIPAQLANRALAREASLRARLAAHAGSSFRIVAGPARMTFVIDADGVLDQAAPDVVPTLVLTIRPLDVPALLHDPARFDEFVRADGDAALAATLKEMSATLPWFVERMFGDAFGAIAGQRLADAGRSLLGLPGYAATRLGASAGSYARDEAHLAASAADVTTFGDDVRALESRIDALAERIDHIAARAR